MLDQFQMQLLLIIFISTQSQILSNAGEKEKDQVIMITLQALKAKPLVLYFNTMSNPPPPQSNSLDLHANAGLLFLLFILFIYFLFFFVVVP